MFHHSKQKKKKPIYYVAYSPMVRKSKSNIIFKGKCVVLLSGGEVDDHINTTLLSVQ